LVFLVVINNKKIIIFGLVVTFSACKKDKSSVARLDQLFVNVRIQKEIYLNNNFLFIKKAIA